jgi:hypothetical protein
VNGVINFKFVILMLVAVKIFTLWNVTPCSVIGTYKLFVPKMEAAGSFKMLVIR